MKRKLLSILLACILVLGASLPVLAGELLEKDKDDKYKDKKVGDKVALETGQEATFIRKEGSKQVWEVDIGDLVYIPGTDTPIDSMWYFTGMEWVSGKNLFEAGVKGSKVTVTYEGVKLSWQPEVFIGEEKLTAGKTARQRWLDPINPNYFGNTLKWEYSNGITRNLRIIEGMLIEYYTIDKKPKDDIRIISHTTQDDGFAWTRPAEAWDANYNYVPLIIGQNDVTLDISELPDNVVFPITIDPDSTFTTSSSDGYFWYKAQGAETNQIAWDEAHDASSSNYMSSAGGVMYVGFDVLGWTTEWSSTVWNYRSLVYFDTSALNGVVITDAVLRVRGYSLTTDVVAWTLGIQDGGAFPNDPFISSDYLHTKWSGNGGTITSANMGTGYKEITLSEDGEDWIDQDGNTNFILRSKTHDIDDALPPNAPDEGFHYNVWKIYTYEAGSGYRPELVVTYTVNVPAATTDAATYVTKTTARLNSTVDDDGGELADIRFGYGTTTQATIAAYDVQTTWVVDTYLTGQHPFVDIATLNANDEYFFRVAIRNDNSTVEGGELSFTTEAAIVTPTNFKAYPSATTVGLTWTKGSGSTQTMIRYSESGYPADETEGDQVYLGTLGSFTITGLTIGHTYYIVAIGETGGEYTATTEVMATTGAASEDIPMPDGPQLPAGMFQAPNPGEIPNFPGYDMFNSVAEDLQIPLATMWMYIILGGVGFAAFIFYKMSHNLMVVMVVIGVGISWGSLIGILPLWWMFAAFILGLGLYQLTMRRDG